MHAINPDVGIRKTSVRMITRAKFDKSKEDRRNLYCFFLHNPVFKAESAAPNAAVADSEI